MMEESHFRKHIAFFFFLQRGRIYWNTWTMFRGLINQSEIIFTQCSVFQQDTNILCWAQSWKCDYKGLFQSNRMYSNVLSSYWTQIQGNIRGADMVWVKLHLRIRKCNSSTKTVVGLRQYYKGKIGLNSCSVKHRLNKNFQKITTDNEIPWVCFSF